MRKHITKNKKLYSVLIILLIVSFGGLVLATGDKQKSTNTTPSTQVKGQSVVKATDTSSTTTTAPYSAGTTEVTVTDTTVAARSSSSTKIVTASTTTPSTSTVVEPTQPVPTPQNPPVENTDPTDDETTGEDPVVTDPTEDDALLTICADGEAITPIQMPVNAVLVGELKMCNGQVVSWQPFYKNMFWGEDGSDNPTAPVYMFMNPADTVSSTLRFAIALNADEAHAAKPGDVIEFAFYIPELGGVYSFRIAFTAAL